LLAHRWRLFRRRAGNPLSLLIGGGMLWIVHHLIGRMKPHWPLTIAETLSIGLGLLMLLSIGLGWQRIRRTEQENDFYLLLPIPPRALCRLWLIELGVALLLPTLALCVALWRLTYAWPSALTPLAWLPGIVGIGLIAGLLPAVAPLALACCALALTGANPLIAGLLLAAILPLTLRLFERRFRQSYSHRRQSGRVRQHVGSQLIATLLRPLPRPMRALLLADILFVARGSFIRGRVALALMLPVPLTYLAWPIPARLAHAPLVISSMLLTFILAGVGYVLGADLSLAEKPHLPLKRLTPVSGKTVWWGRQLLTLVACAFYTALLCGVLGWRHGAAALPLLPVMLIIMLVVSSYTVAFSLAVSGQVDMTAASSIAFGAVVMAFLALTIYLWMPLLLLAYPLTLRSMYARGVERYRQIPAV